jgi:hypothetical protein
VGRLRRAIAAAVILLCGVCDAGAAGTAANPGFVGLWEYPTAEMPDDGAGRFGYTQASPYAFFYADLAWLPWLEINARLTTFDNVHVTSVNEINVEGRGRRYMDKALDLKAMLYRSRRWYMPSLAFGVTDVMGTELMKAWYGVATWSLGRWAFSAGYGTDRLNGLFGGVSWNMTDWLTLKAEYSPLNYSLDHAGAHRPHPDAADAKYNVGAVLKAPWGTEGAVSWQRGEEFVFSLSQRFDLQGSSFLGLGGKSGYDAPGAPRTAQWKDADPEKLGRDLMDALSFYVRVRDVEIGISERKIFAAYENYGHSSDAEAMVRVLVVAAALSPHLEAIFLIPRLRGVPVVCAEFPGELLFGIRARDMETKNPLQAARFIWAEKDFFEAREASERWLFHERGLQNRARHDLRAMAVYELRIDQTLDDDYQSRWSVDFIYENRSSNGWSAFADVRAPVFNDVDIWWEPDMTDEIRLRQAVVGYIKNLNDAGLWVTGEAGWLDENWFGLNLWGRVYSRDGRWWGGTRVGAVRDRNPQSFAGLADGKILFGGGGYGDFGDSPWRSVAWLQGGYSFSEIGLDLQADYGRFADTDVGAKFSAVRRWDGAALGFWISRTERLSPGKDFTNAGVHLELPAERWFGSWLGSPSAHVWDQDVSLLSTWRIDAGREPGSRWVPERMLSQLRPIELKKNVEKLLREYCAFESSESVGQTEQTGQTGQKSLIDFFVK